jgi:hypothetical protein
MSGCRARSVCAPVRQACRLGASAWRRAAGWLVRAQRQHRTQRAPEPIRLARARTSARVHAAPHQCSARLAHTWVRRGAARLLVWDLASGGRLELDCPAVVLDLRMRGPRQTAPAESAAARFVRNRSAAASTRERSDTRRSSAAPARSARCAWAAQGEAHLEPSTVAPRVVQVDLGEPHPRLPTSERAQQPHARHCSRDSAHWPLRRFHRHHRPLQMCSGRYQRLDAQLLPRLRARSRSGGGTDGGVAEAYGL